MKLNPLTLIDFYKASHARQYPEGTSLVFSNLTPRKSRVPGVESMTFFGLQYFIKKYLIETWNEGFFDMPLHTVLTQWERRSKNAGLPLHEEDRERIYKLHNLGYLPLKMMALPEGSQVPMKVPPVILWNTEPHAFWLTNNIESILSTTIWQPSTSATLAREFHKEFTTKANWTVGNTEAVQWQGHDFSFRGMSSLETAMTSGAGHLIYFTGSDTVPAIDFIEEYYHGNSDKELIAASVPATEHSVMCMGGKESEIETFRRLFKLYPGGLLSVVSDTWDFWSVLTNMLPQLKDEIMSRNGKLVIRPDSGDPVDIICGLNSKPNYTPFGNGTEVKGAVEVLWELFGGTISQYGYKVLDSHIGLIYGDSINIDRAREINARLEAKGFASTNWVAGIGSYTYQMNTRDTFGIAMKATYGEITSHVSGGHGEVYNNIEKREIYKDPKTDDGTKKSAKGLIAVYNEGQSFRMVDQATWDQVNNCAYETVFEDGIIKNEQSFADIRERAKKY